VVTESARILAGLRCENSLLAFVINNAQTDAKSRLF
jgi:hypothetical protein